MTGHQALGPLFADAEKNVSIMVSRNVKPGAVIIILLPVKTLTNKQNIQYSYSLYVVGNRRFRILIDLNMQKYKDAKSKIEKSMIVMSIVDDVREASVIGGFVRKVRLF